MCSDCLSEPVDSLDGWEETEWGHLCPECVVNNSQALGNEGIDGVAAALGQVKED